MYEEYYGLREKPFSILPDPQFMYWGRSHSMAFAMLEYGVMNQAGFSVITGEVGLGKTTLVRHLLDTVSEAVTVGVVSNTNEDPRELFQWILLAFDQPFEGTSTVEHYARLKQFLERRFEEGSRCALVVDEAQNLGIESLEQLRMLSNLNANKSQLLQIILVGQPELMTMLQRPELRQFAQRVSCDFNLKRLSLRETVSYIDHRMSVAGQMAPIFSEDAIERIYTISHGIPRVINILCDTALVYGFSMRSRQITPEIIDEVILDRKEHGVFDLEGGKSPLRPVDISGAH